MVLRTLVFLFLVGMANTSFAIKKIDPDPKLVELVSSLMKALQIEDQEKRIAAVLPLVHKTMQTKGGKTLTRDVVRFSFKKASQNVQFYKVPADIYEVHEGRSKTVGWKETAEKGRTDKYFVNKKDDVEGRPAPIAVFIPADGGDPKIIGFGSL